MQKFSKLKPNGKKEKKEDVIYSNDNFKVVQYEDWSIIKEKDSVFCIPYLIESNQLVLRYEYIPTFKYVDGQEFHITLVGGGVETGETTNTAITRELEEEAGIVLNENYKLEPIKPLFISKGLTSKVTLYIIPLNERDYHEIKPPTDGSKIEKISKSVKVDAKYLSSLNASDLMTEYMLLKLKEYLNLE